MAKSKEKKDDDKAKSSSLDMAKDTAQKFGKSLFEQFNKIKEITKDMTKEISKEISKKVMTKGSAKTTDSTAKRNTKPKK